MKKIFTAASAILLVLLLGGWGAVGHKIINRNIYSILPAGMGLTSDWNTFLTSHASDADSRKSSDATESPRHFIDIDYYPEFVANGAILKDYNAFVALHTSATVIAQGIVPWAIVTWEDSLRKLFIAKNISGAEQVAADLGHYCGDGHQPFHLTTMYDTDLFGKSGLHSRYETTLVTADSGNIVYTNSTASYVSNVSDYVFSFIYADYKYLRNAQYGDSVAQKTAGSTSGTTYLNTFWGIAGPDIITLMKNASKATADLIYTAWVDAGNQLLPVELVSFTANQTGNYITLKWNTATEINNSGFDIERSTDRITWNKLSSVSGSGNSNSVRDYSYLDKSVKLFGMYYYRLIQKDNNGGKNYSDVINVNYTGPDMFSLEQNYPNPFNPDTKIKYSLPQECNVRITVYNSLGESVKTLVSNVESSGSHEIRFDASGLSSGIYICSIQANSIDGRESFRSSKKMSLLK